MKKLLLLIVGFVVAFAAQAQNYFLHGQIFGDPTWSSVALIKDGDNYEYTGYLVTGNFGISIRSGVDISTQTKWIGGGATIANANTEYNFSTGGNSSNSLSGFYTIVYKPSSNKIIFEKRYYFLHGQITGNSNWESVPLTKVGDNFEYTGDLVTGDFGIRICSDDQGLDQKLWIGGGATIANANTEYNFSIGGNSSNSLSGFYTIIYNPTTHTIAFISTGPAVSALYLHVKNDIRRHGQKDAAPWVWLYKKGTADDIKYTKDLTHRQMVKVDGDMIGGGNEKYSLWKCDLTQEDVDNYDACGFYFRNQDNSFDKVYRSATYNNNSDDVANYDKANWYKYIYATATNNNRDFAVQTYLSYDEFKALDQLDKNNGGRRNIYLVGGVKYGEWSPTTDNNNNIINETSLSGVPEQGIKFGHPDSDQGCFYIPLKKDGDNRWFKITWLDVNTLREGKGVNSDRDWATFDLGLIGVKGFDNPNIKVDKNNTTFEPTDEPIYFDNIAPNGELRFTENQSVAYSNYNQANWVLPNNDKWYWLVLDSHDECRSATICTFNPQPSVNVNVSSIEKVTLTAEEANNIEYTSLMAAEANGEITMTNLNKASGSATIVKSPGYVLDAAKYSVQYTLNLNGHTITSDNPGTVTMDYIPLAAEARLFSVRAKYKNQKSKLTFHSRTGTGTITLPEVELNAPTALEISGRYIYQGDDATGKQIYGIYTENLNCEFTPGTLNAYSDFNFDKGTGYFVRKGLPWYDTYSSNEFFTSNVKTWTNYSATEWSENLMNLAEGEVAPLFIEDVVTVDSFDDLKNNYNNITRVFSLMFQKTSFKTPENLIKTRA